MTDCNRRWHLLCGGTTVLSAPDLAALRRLALAAPILPADPQEAYDAAIAGALNRLYNRRLTTLSRGLDSLLTELICHDARYGHTTVLDAHLLGEQGLRWQKPDPGF